MKTRSTIVAVLVGLALVAGCSSTSEVDDAAADAARTSTDVPRWIRDGVRIARATKAARQKAPTTDASGAIPSVTVASSGTTDAGSLPSREVVVAALANTGMTATQAGCVYDNIAANPATAANVSALLKGLAGASTPTGGTVDPAAVPALASLTPENATSVVMAIAPCLDQATLLGLLAVGQDAGGTASASGAAGPAAIAALLNSAQGVDLTKLAGIDLNAIASSAAGALGAQQQQILAALLAEVGKAQSEITKNPLVQLQIGNLDLTQLSKEQLPILLLALLKGLTSEQQRQLAQLAQVSLDDLDLDINPDELTPEEIGALLLVLAPLLAGALKSPTATVPPGGDPGQVYIPPGLDLSNMNPLIFLNRDDVLAQFAKDGVDPKFGGCLFDGMARLPPSSIASFFSTDKSGPAAGQIVLLAIGCLAGG